MFSTNKRRDIIMPDKPELEFYDVKTKKKFKATNYRFEERGGRHFAVTKSPAGTHECWRVVKKQ